MKLHLVLPTEFTDPPVLILSFTRSDVSSCTLSNRPLPSHADNVEIPERRSQLDNFVVLGYGFQS